MGIFWGVLDFLSEVIDIIEDNIFFPSKIFVLLFRVNLLISFFYAFCDLVIGEAEHRTVAFFWLVVSIAVYAYVTYTRHSEEYRELLTRHEKLRREHEYVKKYNEKYANPKYWFSLLLNPNRGNVVIATNSFETYVDGIGFAYSEYMSATMYGDGRIVGSYSGGRPCKNIKINRQPETKEEVELFFGRERASQLWTYWEFYRDFRDFVEGRNTSKKEVVRELAYVSPEVNTQESVSRNYFIDLPYPENLSLPQQHQWYRSQGYNAWLVSRPDFNEFNKWYMRYIRAKGAIAGQVGFLLYSYVEKHGGDFSLVRKILSNWYKKFQLERHGKTEQA